jgi:hypothetical protein
MAKIPIQADYVREIPVNRVRVTYWSGTVPVRNEEK